MDEKIENWHILFKLNCDNLNSDYIKTAKHAFLGVK